MKKFIEKDEFKGKIEPKQPSFTAGGKDWGIIIVKGNEKKLIEYVNRFQINFDNIIFDVTATTLTKKEIEEQIQEISEDRIYLTHVSDIVVKRGEELVGIYRRSE